MITLDTSGILALLNRADRDHARARDAVKGDRGPLIVLVGILSEAASMIEVDLGADVLRGFLDDIVNGFYALDCGEEDVQRIGDLLERYADLRLGFADACAIACAERNGGRVLTFNERDFRPVSSEGTITLVPAS